MKKRLVLALGGLVAVLMGVAMFAAFESHIINIEAHVEKATFVRPTQIDMDTVFPQENVALVCKAEGPLDPVTLKPTAPTGTIALDTIVQVTEFPCAQIYLSASFRASTRWQDVHYDVYWADKPCVPSKGDGNPETTGDTKKCEGADLTNFPWTGTFIEHDICPYIQLFDSDPFDNNDVILVPAPFNCQPAPGPAAPSLVATGTLFTGVDEYDLWDMAFWVPVCTENFNPETDGAPDPPTGIPQTTDFCWDPEGVGDSYGETDLSNELKFQITSYTR